MRTIFDAAGGMDGLRRLAGAWHARVMADEVVSHAFSHGFHPEHTTRLAAYWADPRLRQALHDYFAWATTTTMRQYHASAGDVPDGLSMPRWSWDGLDRDLRDRHAGPIGDATVRQTFVEGEQVFGAPGWR